MCIENISEFSDSKLYEEKSEFSFVIVPETEIMISEGRVLSETNGEIIVVIAVLKAVQPENRTMLEIRIKLENIFLCIIEFFEVRN